MGVTIIRKRDLPIALHDSLRFYDYDMAIELECRVNKPKTQYVKSDDLYIAYQVFGDGPIDLVYLPGWLTNIEYAWESPDYARFLQKNSPASLE